ncbi:hypothetical protein B0H10DRAFT_1963913 [Mycena sp. CBHHK59/15]|nr:hypothetical protein B0H10DRAFT_1963913 [Mycena sp. CBHHK59/15]
MSLDPAETQQNECRMSSGPCKLDQLPLWSPGPCRKTSVRPSPAKKDGCGCRVTQMKRKQHEEIEEAIPGPYSIFRTYFSNGNPKPDGLRMEEQMFAEGVVKDHELRVGICLGKQRQLGRMGPLTIESRKRLGHCWLSLTAGQEIWVGLKLHSHLLEE